jgi:hypothetical protein
MVRVFTIRSAEQWTKAIAELGIPESAIRKAPGAGGRMCRAVRASPATIERLSALKCVIAVCHVGTGIRRVMSAQGQTRRPGSRRSQS